MKVNLKTKNKLELTAKEKGYLYEKIESLKDMFGDRHEVSAAVLCSVNGSVYTVEVTIPTKRLILRAESRGDTLFAAVDLAADKIERQFIRHKKKLNTLIKKREGISNYYSDKTEETETDVISKLVKTKQVEAEIMSVDEAILQLEMLDHDFYLFISEETHKPTLVYLRKDGNYGTIEIK